MVVPPKVMYGSGDKTAGATGVAVMESVGTAVGLGAETGSTFVIGAGAGEMEAAVVETDVDAWTVTGVAVTDLAVAEGEAVT